MPPNFSQPFLRLAYKERLVISTPMAIQYAVIILNMNRHFFCKQIAPACRVTGVPPIENLNNYRRFPASVIRITKWILTGEVEIVLNVFSKKGKHERIPGRVRRSYGNHQPRNDRILTRDDPGTILFITCDGWIWDISHWICSKERSLVERLCNDPKGNDSRCQSNSQAAAALRLKGGPTGQAPE